MAVIPASLNLDFARTRQLDPRITFTNASGNRSYFDANGVMKFAAVDEPRFDHNPITGESLGLLIEEQRTNLLTYSEQFDNADWVKTASSVTSNTIIAPDGLLSGDLMVPSATLDRHYIIQSYSGLTTATYTLSVYAKQAAGSYEIGLLFGATAVTSSSRGSARWNLQTGAFVLSGSVGNLTITSSSIVPVGNGWYRCAVSFVPDTTGATSSFSYGIAYAPTGQSLVTNWTADGISGVYIWGAQLEAGAFQTSYIKTEASQVTRAADSAVMTGTNFSSWYNAAEGTLFANADTADVNNSRVSVFISDGTTANRIQTNADTALKAFIAASGATQLQQGVPSAVVTNNVASKVALAYSLNNGTGAANGTLGFLDTTLTVPVVNQMQLGGRGLNVQVINGCLRRVAYYPRRLSDAQLRAITS